jgi:hypothetical protein
LKYATTRRAARVLFDTLATQTRVSPLDPTQKLGPAPNPHKVIFLDNKIFKFEKINFEIVNAAKTYGLLLLVLTLVNQNRY